MSIDDLVELLHSVDHEVVNSKDAVISDSALEALLNRTLRKDKPGSSQTVGTEEKDASSGVPGSTEHTELFKVIAERDSKGNLVTGDQDKNSTGEDGVGGDPSLGSTASDRTEADPSLQRASSDRSEEGTAADSTSTGTIEKRASVGDTNSIGSAESTEPEKQVKQADNRSSTSPDPASSTGVRSSSVTSSTTTCSSGADDAHTKASKGVVITESVVGVCAAPSASGSGEGGGDKSESSISVIG